MDRNESHWRLSVALSVLSFCCSALCSAEGLPSADVSFLVVDLKYSQASGVKICEMQQGSLSTFYGDAELLGGESQIATSFAQFFTQFHAKKWAHNLAFKPFSPLLASLGWSVQDPLWKIATDPDFLACASISPSDVSDLSSYSGILFCTGALAKRNDDFIQRCPGILFVDRITLPLWDNKAKMSSLFRGNPILEKRKAEWRCYPKQYDADLASRIQEELEAEYYVIKPLSESVGRGVIIIPESELDALLRLILQSSPSLKKNELETIAYWAKNNDDSFIVEKYYPSDSVVAMPWRRKTQQESAFHHYDATMRMAFILVRDRGVKSFYCLGAYWRLPLNSIEEGGSPSETMMTTEVRPRYLAVDEAVLNDVAAQIEEAMLLLYDKMLDRSVFCNSASSSGLRENDLLFTETTGRTCVRQLQR